MSRHFSVAWSMQFNISGVVLVNIYYLCMFFIIYYLITCSNYACFFALVGLFPQLCKKRPAGNTVVENACLLVSLRPSANV